MYRKEALLNELAERKRPDILTLTECDVTNYEPYKSLKIGNMTMYASKPVTVRSKDERGRKVTNKKVRTITFVKESSFKEVKQITHGIGNRSEVWLKCVTHTGIKYTIGGVYQEWIQPGRIAGRDNAGLVKTMRNFADQKTMIMGDWNFCLERNEEAEYIEEIKSMGYEISQDGYTFHRRHKDREPTQSILDWRLSNIIGIQPVKKTWEGVSDHAWIEFELPGKLETDPTWLERRRKKDLFTEQSVTALEEALNGKVEDHMSVEQMTRKLVSETISHLDKYAPLQKFKENNNRKNKTSERVAQLRRAMKNAKREGRTEAYHRNQERYRGEILRERRDGLERDIEKFGMKAAWKLRKRKTEPPIQAVRIRDQQTGKFVTDKEAANGFMETFVQKVRDAAPENYMQCGQANNSDLRPPGTEAIPTDYYPPRTLAELQPRTEKEVEEMIKSMKDSEATDYYGLSQRDFKGLAKGLIKPLTKMINKSMLERKFPDELKQAKIKPLPKTGKNTEHYKSYRPISLLSPFGKIVELTMKETIIKFATERDLLPQQQHGYQKGRSVISAISEALKEVDIRQRSGLKTGIVCFDFSCAFDLVSIEKLMKRMRDLGFGRELREWIESYLTRRKAFVEVNGERSEVVTLEFGTPQGSIVSPLLFLILISDMGFSFEGLLVGYADDSTNVISGTSVEDLHEKMTDSIKRMTKYAEKTGMCLNIEKTEFMYFGRTTLPPIRIGDKTLEESKEIKFLGVYLNKEGNATANLKHLATKVNYERATLRRICYNLPLQARKRLAVGILWPKITSAIETYTNPLATSGDRTISKLQTMWNETARMVLRVRRRDQISTGELMQMMGTHTVYEESLNRHGKLLHDLLIGDGDLRYLGEYQEDSQRVDRPRRELRLRTTNGKGSPVDRCRRLWNIIQKANLAHILHEDRDEFMKNFKASSKVIEEYISRT